MSWPERWRPMINQTNQGTGGNAELRSDASSASRLMSPKNVVEQALQSMQPERTTPRPAPQVMRMADLRALEAYVERRRKLAARIRLENPSRTEEEIEERLEQFGA